MAKIQIVLDMQNPKLPGIRVSLEGWLLRKLNPRIEVVLHKGGNNYTIPSCKKVHKEELNGL